LLGKSHNLNLNVLGIYFSLIYIQELLSKLNFILVKIHKMYGTSHSCDLYAAQLM